ncbi:MAG: iron-containing alcohol dehydrogenase [Desulfobacteraceae bacterium]|nr:iron-containing alcohol dehydrogenase [Desulfobacteraceae bacterium]MBC2757180.1 iron-containing alcohol dehydrogenase [Desulfobacteraceae bacterium]
MNQYNFPTIILSGQGALAEFVHRLTVKNYQRVFVVTDAILKACGVLGKLTSLLDAHQVAFSVFAETHPNPIEEDVTKGTAAFKATRCDSIIALGGGSPMDAAKAIKIMAANEPPLAQYDDAIGGDRLIKEPMPPLYAIPTTAGTGSEVGRSAVIISSTTGKKAIYFHPDLLPDMAVLEPELTVGLPPHITAATGVDAFVHCLEAYFAPGFHPIADGIALQGLELVLDWLPRAVEDGRNLDARERMLIAATMGAAAFQKGLGMIHSLAHPLSSRCNMHHGLANALLMPAAISFIENANLDTDQRNRVKRVQALFSDRGYPSGGLAEMCRQFIENLGIAPGLLNHSVLGKDLESLAQEALEDPCHQANMIPVELADLLSVYKAAL